MGKTGGLRFQNGVMVSDLLLSAKPRAVDNMLSISAEVDVDDLSVFVNECARGKS